MTGQLLPSVCIDAVFGELSVTDAVQATASAGISAFEFWGWWDKDLDEILRARDTHQMQIAACCTKFVSMVDAGKRSEYLAGLEASIAAAKRLNCTTLISQVGDARPGVDRREQHNCLVDGLKAAAPMLEQAGVQLVIEPLNDLIDHPGYYLVRSNEAFEIIDEVGCEQVKVVFDIYHQQISEGHLIKNIEANIARIGHFHAAGNPGRHELNVGELHYPSIIKAIQAMPYQGYFGLEYWPQRDAVEVLREVAKWFTKASPSQSG